MRSPAAVVGGVVMTSIGGTAVVVGGIGVVVFAGLNNDTAGAALPLAALIALGGGAFLAGGIPLMVWGARDEPVHAATAPRPSVRLTVGPAGAGAMGTF